MACGCKKPKRTILTTEATENDAEMVSLNLRETVALPVLIPDVVNGKAMAVLPPGHDPVAGVINVYGRQAQVSRRVKKLIYNQWPTAFNSEDIAAEFFHTAVTQDA